MSHGVPYFIWRDGRPRWTPSRKHREAGIKGKDLKDEADNWLPLEEALDAARAINTRLGINPKRGPKVILRIPDEDVAGRAGKSGFIYFLWVGHAVKVGFSVMPARRLGTLETGISGEVRMFMTVPGTMADERRLHKRLQAQRVRGEWFKANGFTFNVLRMVMNETLQLRNKA